MKVCTTGLTILFFNVTIPTDADSQAGLAKQRRCEVLEVFKGVKTNLVSAGAFAPATEKPGAAAHFYIIVRKQ